MLKGFIVTTKETLPNWVIGCQDCVFVGACSKHEKSRNEFVSSKSVPPWNITTASSTPFDFVCHVDRKNDRKWYTERLFFLDKEKKIFSKWKRIHADVTQVFIMLTFEFAWTFWYIFSRQNVARAVCTWLQVDYRIIPVTTSWRNLMRQFQLQSNWKSIHLSLGIKQLRCFMGPNTGA